MWPFSNCLLHHAASNGWPSVSRRLLYVWIIEFSVPDLAEVHRCPYYPDWFWKRTEREKKSRLSDGKRTRRCTQTIVWRQWIIDGQRLIRPFHCFNQAHPVKPCLSGSCEIPCLWDGVPRGHLVYLGVWGVEDGGRREWWNEWITWLSQSQLVCFDLTNVSLISEGRQVCVSCLCYPFSILSGF